MQWLSHVRPALPALFSLYIHAHESPLADDLSLPLGEDGLSPVSSIKSSLYLFEVDNYAPELCEKRVNYIKEWKYL